MIVSRSSILTFCAIAIGAVGLSGFVAPAQAADANATASKLPFSEDQRAAMEDFVRNFILDNPEVLMESVNRYRRDEEQKKEEGSVKILKENMAFLNNGTHPQIGNPKGDVTIVEFFDYNCGYCKHAVQTLRKLAETDKNVRIIFMDYPILSPQSSEAAKWAVAANKQGKYWPFHQALLESSAPKDAANMAKIAKSVGLDVEKLKADAVSRDVAEHLAAVTEFGHKLNVEGTPAFIVGDQILRGYLEYEAFKTIVDDQHKKVAK